MKKYIIDRFRKGITHVVDETRRFWNWRVPAKNGKLNFREKVVSKILASEIIDSSELSLTHIDFILKPPVAPRQNIKNVTFEKCLFAHQAIANYTFNGCTFIECNFNGAEFDEAEFHKCIFDECFFYKTKFRSTYLDPASLRFSSKWHWNFANVNAWLFQNLYRNSRDMHQEVFAMNSDRRFQFYRRYEFLRGQNPRPLKFLTGLLFDYLLGHGYGIKNSLTVTVFMIITFAWLIQDYSNKGSISIWNALYFSIVSFTTVGYGDLTPKLEAIPIALTSAFLLFSIAWCAVVTAIIVKRIVK